MALAQMQQGKSNAFVAWHLERGFSTTEIRAALRERYPGQPTNSINAALYAGQAAYAAALQQRQLPAGTVLAAGAVPSGGTSGSGYRYYAQVRLNDPNTGGVAERTFSVAAASALDPIALEQHIANLINQTYNQGLPHIGASPPLQNVTLQAYSVYAVERATV